MLIDGRIVENGSYDELMSHDDGYFKKFSRRKENGDAVKEDDVFKEAHEVGVSQDVGTCSPMDGIHSQDPACLLQALHTLDIALDKLNELASLKDPTADDLDGQDVAGMVDQLAQELGTAEQLASGLGNPAWVHGPGLP